MRPTVYAVRVFLWRKRLLGNGNGGRGSFLEVLVFDLSLKTKSVRIEQEGKKAVMKQEQRASRVTGVCKRDEQDMF